MANKNDNKNGEEEETNKMTKDFETIFKHYDNVEDNFRSMPLVAPYRSSMPDENYTNDDNDDSIVDDDVVGFNNSKYNYNQNNTTKSVNSWDNLDTEPFPNYVLINNKGAKKNEIAIEIGVDINMDVGNKLDMDNKNTDINDKNVDINDKNTDMEDMYMQMPMPIRTQKGQEEIIKTELEKCEYPVWDDGIDRFTNCLARPNLSPSSLMSLTKGILEKLNQEKSLFMTAGHEYNNNKNEILTYICCKNLLLCRIVLSPDQISEFQIGVYLDKNDNCLLDIQELSGEHLTFAHFLHIFKSQLEQQQIIDASTPTPEFLDNYGMSMEINLDSFDEM